jgi:hypothetical protein
VVLPLDLVVPFDAELFLVVVLLLDVRVADEERVLLLLFTLERFVVLLFDERVFALDVRVFVPLLIVERVAELLLVERVVLEFTLLLFVARDVLLTVERVLLVVAAGRVAVDRVLLELTAERVLALELLEREA